MSSQIHQNYFTKVETAVNSSVNLHLWASFTYLSLRFYIDHDNVAPGGVGPFSHELAKEKYPVSLEWCKPSAVTAPSSRTCRSLSRQALKIQDAMEAALLTENLNQAVLDLWALGSARADPHLCGSRKAAS